MDCFESAPLTSAGTVVLRNEEVEIKLFEDVEVSHNGEDSQQQQQQSSIFSLGHHSSSGPTVLFPSCTLYLTNFRVVLIIRNHVGKVQASSIGWGLNLSVVNQFEEMHSMFSRSFRLKVYLTKPFNRQLCLKFSHEGDIFLSLALKQLSKRSWLSVAPPPRVVDEPKFSVQNAGVSGLQRRQATELKHADAVTKDALKDLDSLVGAARNVISVVQRYAALTTQQSDATGDGEAEDNRSETTSEAGERNEIESILQSIGMLSPVTQFSAGRKYHEQLSRQLADFLLQKQLLQRMGGIATLTDVYCLYNRARGTALVSPNDLLKAAEGLDALHVGLRFRRFPSGVLSICLDTLTDEKMQFRIVSLLQQPPHQTNGLSAHSLARLTNVSLLVAKEQLLACERSRALCRDDTVEGVFFFVNMFEKEFKPIGAK